MKIILRVLGSFGQCPAHNLRHNARKPTLISDYHLLKLFAYSVLYLNFGVIFLNYKKLKMKLKKDSNTVLSYSHTLYVTCVKY